MADTFKKEDYAQQNKQDDNVVISNVDSKRSKLKMFDDN